MEEISKQNMDYKSEILTLNAKAEKDASNIAGLRRDKEDLQEDVSCLQNDVSRLQAEMRALEISTQEQQHALQQHITERNAALQAERETVRALKADKAAQQAKLIDASQELERRRRDVTALGEGVVDESESLKKSLNHVLVATEESMTQFAVALRTVKEALRKSERTRQEQALALAELEETVQKLEGALQEKKEAEVALRVRAASAEGCLRVQTASAQARIKELETLLQARVEELDNASILLEQLRAEKQRADAEARAREQALEEERGTLRVELRASSEERDETKATLKQHDIASAHAQQEAAAREHALQSQLVAERAQRSELERANEDMRRRLHDAAAEVQKTKAELLAASELTDRRWASLQASREEIVGLEASRTQMREQLVEQAEMAQARADAALKRAEQAETEVGSMQLVQKRLERQVAAAQAELHELVSSRNSLRWDAEASTGLLRGQIYDIQSELSDVIAHVKFQQDDQLARLLAQGSHMHQFEKRVLDLESERESLREQLVRLQMDLQAQCDSETASRLKAATIEGNLRVAAQAAQSRVHYVEGVNAALRQTLQEATELSRGLVQDSYTSQLVLAEMDLRDEQEHVMQTISGLENRVVVLVDELEGSRNSVDEHAVARCRLEFEAGEAQLKVERLRKEQERAKQQLVTTGAQRAMALMQPQLAQLRASLGDLQDELWQSTRHVATALAAESAAADAARRETEDEHEEVLKLQARMELLREAMRLRDQDEKHDAMEDRLRLSAAETAAQEASGERRRLQEEVHKLEKQLSAANIRMRQVEEHARQAQQMKPELEALRGEIEGSSKQLHAAAIECRTDLQETAALRERVGQCAGLMRSMHAEYEEHMQRQHHEMQQLVDQQLLHHQQRSQLLHALPLPADLPAYKATPPPRSDATGRTDVALAKASAKAEESAERRDGKARVSAVPLWAQGLSETFAIGHGALSMVVGGVSSPSDKKHSASKHKGKYAAPPGFSESAASHITLVGTHTAGKRSSTDEEPVGNPTDTANETAGAHVELLASMRRELAHHQDEFVQHPDQALLKHRLSALSAKVHTWERDSPYSTYSLDAELPLSLTKARPVSALEMWRERERDRDALARARERDSASAAGPKKHIIGARTAPLVFPSSRRPATASSESYSRYQRPGNVLY